jgi:AcrR family transcriptional regulator
MQKGDRTRDAILREAVELASVVGLNGVTIGSLAGHTGLSKSGLFGHFGSKEQLQLATLQAGVARFTDSVIAPALQRPRGLARLRALFDAWLAWSDDGGPTGGCILVAAGVEVDDQPGPTRDYLVDTGRRWLDFLAGAARLAIDEGEFRPDLDGVQFAHELNAIYLGFHHARRLLRDPTAKRRAWTAYDRLIEDATA